MFIIGQVDHLIFRNEENGYTVAVVDNNGDFLTCVGKFPSVTAGQRVEINMVNK